MAIGGARSRPSPAGWYEEPAEPRPLPGLGPVTAPALQGPELGPGGLWGERLGRGAWSPALRCPSWPGDLGSCVFICHRDVGVRPERALCDCSAPFHVFHAYLGHFLPQVKPSAGHSSQQRGGGPPGRGRWTDGLSPPAGPGRPLGTSRCQRPRAVEEAGRLGAWPQRSRGAGGGFGLAASVPGCALCPAPRTLHHGPSFHFPGRWG